MQSTGKKKKHQKLDYVKIGKILRKEIRGRNEASLKPHGPYGLAAVELNWANTLRNRKHLQTIWKKNRGNVCVDRKLKGNHYIPFEHILGQNMNELNQCSVRSMRDRRAKTFSPNWVTGKRVTIGNNTKVIFCVCQKNYRDVDGGRMIECERCLEWYHFSCLKYKPLDKRVNDARIRFECGQEKCTSTICKLLVDDIEADKIDNKDNNKDNKADNSLCTKSNTTNCNDPIKIPTMITKEQNLNQLARNNSLQLSHCSDATNLYPVMEFASPSQIDLNLLHTDITTTSSNDQTNIPTTITNHQHSNSVGRDIYSELSSSGDDSSVESSILCNNNLLHTDINTTSYIGHTKNKSPTIITKQQNSNQLARDNSLQFMQSPLSPDSFIANNSSNFGNKLHVDDVYSIETNSTVSDKFTDTDNDQSLYDNRKYTRLSNKDEVSRVKNIMPMKLHNPSDTGMSCSQTPGVCISTMEKEHDNLLSECLTLRKMYNVTTKMNKCKSSLVKNIGVAKEKYYNINQELLTKELMSINVVGQHDIEAEKTKIHNIITQLVPTLERLPMNIQTKNIPSLQDKEDSNLDNDMKENNSLSSVLKVLTELEELKKEMAVLENKLTLKNFKYFNEKLTVLILDLDAIETIPQSCVKPRKKRTINLINRYIELFEKSFSKFEISDIHEREKTVLDVASTDTQHIISEITRDDTNGLLVSECTKLKNIFDLMIKGKEYKDRLNNYKNDHDFHDNEEIILNILDELADIDTIGYHDIKAMKELTINRMYEYIRTKEHLKWNRVRIKLEPELLDYVKEVKNVDCVISVLTKLNNIKNKVQDEYLSGKTFNYIEKQFTALLLELDALDTEPNSCVESRIKRTINLINNYIKIFNSQRCNRINSFTGLLSNNSESSTDECIGKLLSSSMTLCSSSESISDHDDNLQNDNWNVQLDRETIGKILHYNLPDKHFTFKLSENANFTLDREVWDYLLFNRDGRVFKKSTWQHFFIKGLKESNPYCSFVFIRHQISSATTRQKKKNTSFFKCDVKCKFSSCPVKACIKVDNIYEEVFVRYIGEICHNISEQHARPIRGTERNQIKRDLDNGIKPLKYFTEKLNSYNRNVLISGNMDGLGKDSRVFCQIASEARQLGRHDREEIRSLELLCKELKGNDDYGFIQKICCFPMYVLYWSEEGLNLYHQMAKKDILFWDATGSVVRRNSSGKSFLYYELAVRNPVKGKMGIPVCAMISEDQSLPTVLDWIQNFRHAEKQLFGYNNISQPRIIMSDEALVFILAALKEYNVETLSDFLNRSWEIVTGKADTTAMKKTIVHVCASHFMKKVKKFCAEHYKRNVSVGLYMMSLLLNCKTMNEIQEILYDICVTLKSEFITEKNSTSIERLIHKINNFDTSVIESFNVNESLEEGDETSVQPGYYTESDFFNLGGTSPFRRFGKFISQKAEECIVVHSEDGKRNRYHSLIFLKQILERYLPHIPLWSSLLLGDLSRFNLAYTRSDSGNFTIKTTSTIENRFRILKHIGLGGRKRSRIDEFSFQLLNQTKAVQQLAAKDCLKPRLIKRKRKSKRTTTTVHEEWNKKQRTDGNLESKGIFQQPPKSMFTTGLSLDVDFNMFKSSKRNKKEVINNKKSSSGVAKKWLPLKSDSVQTIVPDTRYFNISTPAFCPMQNFGSTCWFNATVQALSASNTSKRMIEMDLHTPIHCGTESAEEELKTQAQSLLIKLFKFMSNSENHGKEFHQLYSAVHLVCQAYKTLGGMNTQKDACEFNMTVINPIVRLLKDTLTVKSEIKCCKCKSSTIAQDSSYQTLNLHLPPFPAQSLSISNLLDIYFKNETADIHCSCGSTQKTIVKSISELPQTLILTVKRYKFDPNSQRTIKTKFPLKITEEIDLSNYLLYQSHLSMFTKYHLKSIICHIGGSLNSGHYLAYVQRNDSLYELDDKKITLMGKNIDSNILSSSYIFIYDQVLADLPLYIQPFLICIVCSKAMSAVRTSVVPSQLDSFRHKLLRATVEINITDEILNDIRIIISDKNPYQNPLEFNDFLSKFERFVLSDKVFDTNIIDASFKTKWLIVSKCDACNHLGFQEHQSFIREVTEISTGSIFNLDISQVIQNQTLNCKCLFSEVSIYVSSVPKLLLVQLGNSSYFKKDYFHFEFSIAKNAYYSPRRASYSLKSVLAKKGRQYDVLLVQDNNLVRQTSQKEENSSVILSVYDNLVLFYDIDKNVFNLKLNNLRVDILKNLDNLNLPKREWTDRSYKKNETLVNNLYISSEMVNHIRRGSSWLNSDEINVFLHLLAHDTSDRIHVVDAGWFSHKMLHNGDPSMCTWTVSEVESRKESWMNKHFVIIPLNYKNVHWSVCVLDIEKKILHYCDPLGRPNDLVIVHLLRVLSHNIIYHSGLNDDLQLWKVSNYCMSETFPKQKDGSSCGDFICAIVNAIILNKKIPDSNIIQKYRDEIAYQITEAYLT